LGLSGWIVKQTTSFHTMLRLKMGGALLPLPLRLNNVYRNKFAFTSPFTQSSYFVHLNSIKILKSILNFINDYS